MPMPRTLAHSFPEFSADITIHRGLAGASPRHVVKENQRLVDMHRNVLMKLVVDGGCLQKRMHDIGWSDEKWCRLCAKGGNQIREGLEKWEKLRKRIGNGE